MRAYVELQIAKRSVAYRVRVFAFEWVQGSGAEER
jgi:hypothetical protein